jgi:hypothetical protein
MELIRRSSEDEVSRRGSTRSEVLTDAGTQGSSSGLIVQRVLPLDLSGFERDRILFYMQSNPSKALGDDDLELELRKSSIWDGLTRVYHCESLDRFALWWDKWRDHFAPEIRIFTGRGSAEDVAAHESENLFKTETPVLRLFEAGNPFRPSTFIPQHIFLDSTGLVRWQLACRGLELDPNIRLFPRRNAEVHYRRDRRKQDRYLTDFATHVMYNWPSRKIGKTSDAYIPCTIVAVVTIVYGGLHALCWHSHFPTVTERILWRVSSLVIAGGPLTLICECTGLTITTLLIKKALERLKISSSQRRGAMAYIVASIFLLLMILCIGVYVGARVFILIEAFIFLRSLPPGAYQTPNWTLWLLHL